LTENPSALNVPLRTATSSRILGNLIKSVAKFDWKAVSDFWQHKLDKSRSWWDPSGLSEKQLKEKEEKQNAL
jgi:hypothetical protein